MSMSIDASFPTFPAIIGSVETPGDALGIDVRGNIACVADFEVGIQVIDLLSCGACLYDNGPPNGVNGYSNGVVGAIGVRHTLFDDFFVPAVGWEITDFHWEHVWDTLPVGSGTGAEISIREDNAGQPGSVIQALTITQLSPAPAGFVAGHGTSTRGGDVVEVRSRAEIFQGAGAVP